MVIRGKIRFQIEQSGKQAAKICEKEFLRVLPYNCLYYLYCGSHDVDVILNDETITGVLLDAYIPESRLAFVVIDRGTKTETRYVYGSRSLM